MSTIFRFSVSPRRSQLLLTLAALAGFSPTLCAQTAPQLLPYTAKVVAGGGTAPIGKGATCPVSGFTSTDAYGDGCLATEIQLTGPRYATADVNGNIFFSDYANGLIRRVDAVTGVVTAVAGGVPYTASPSTSTALISTAPAVCGPGLTTTPTDVKGDGCLGTQVFLANPTGLVFSLAGDLYFSEVGNSSSPQEKVFGGDVRKIAATGGVITTTGVISTVDGALSSYFTYGYTANNYSASPACSTAVTTNCITAATSSYMDAPYGLAFDKNGDLYIAEEGKEAVLVVNTSASATTVTGVTIPPGTVAKIAGATASSSTCPNGSSGTNGCTAGLFPTTGTPSANSSEVHYPYAIALDTTGNVYFANEYPYDVAKISSSGIISNYAGIQNSPATLTKPVTTRGVAGSFAIGSPHGVAADTYTASNIYLTDSVNGIVWRVDGAGQYMYPVAGGAKTVCGAATDTYGDGCPATSATFGASSSGSTGLFGISVDTNANLYVGDTITNLVREVSSGTQFGAVGANQPTQYVDVHFAAGDSPSTSVTPFAVTAGSANFTLGTPSCTTNTDTTKDCILPITATPSVLGGFGGTLTVVASVGGTSTFPLSGTFVNSPATRTVVTTSSAANCTNSSTYASTTPVTLTATVYSGGSPGGTVTFFSNGVQIGMSQNVMNGVATLSNYTFPGVNTYAVTATYNGDSYYTMSTSAPVNVTTVTPNVGTQVLSYQSSPIVPGQTAIYSFNTVQNDYTGTLTFSCSGLPAHSSCVFSTASIVATGCSTTNTVALSIVTQQASSAIVSSIGGNGTSLWSIVCILLGASLALLIGLRSRAASRFGRIGMVFALLLTAFGCVSCSSGTGSIPATPAGSYTITVTVSGSTGTTSTFTVPLNVS